MKVERIYFDDSQSGITVTSYSKAQCRQDLIDSFELMKKYLEDIDQEAPVLSIIVPKCGCQADFQTLNDLPYDSVCCEHGHPLIQFQIIDIKNMSKRRQLKMIKQVYSIN